MQPDDRNFAYLWDMLQAARELSEMNEGVSFDAFIDDLKLMRATERSLEVIGEAARRLSDDFTASIEGINWRAIIGQRNIIAHEYGQIDYRVLYQTVVDDIPQLIGQLEELIPEIEA